MLKSSDAINLAKHVLSRSLRTLDNELQVVQINESRFHHELDVVALCEYIIKSNKNDDGKDND